jgi:fused signal recognition particle receptor
VFFWRRRNQDEAEAAEATEAAAGAEGSVDDRGDALPASDAGPGPASEVPTPGDEADAWTDQDIREALVGMELGAGGFGEEGFGYGLVVEPIGPGPEAVVLPPDGPAPGEAPAGEGAVGSGPVLEPVTDDEASTPAAAPSGEEDAAELSAGLQKSRSGFISRLRGFLGGVGPAGPDWGDVEETLIAGDVGGALSMEIVERARARRDPDGPEAAVRAELAALLVARDPAWAPAPASEGGPAVILVVGVNGTGKTTTIGKLAARYRREGARVVLAAADTFRAAAIEQLGEWSRRAGAEIVAHAPGADPGAVVYDALDAAVARRADVVIADTAGRLHTKSNLMDELSKIRRIVDKRLPGARPETLFVLDATTGQNGLAQARAFHEAVGLTGIVLTKLDSTAKGGIVFAIEATLQIPVRYVGVGERAEDLVPFDPGVFVEALFA